MLKDLCAARQHLHRTVLINDLFKGCHAEQYKDDKINFYKYFDVSASETVAITCHHDIVNRHSDNCLDNNASVYNILMLNEEIQQHNPKYNILLAIVDEEESGGGGIMRLMDCWTINQHIDLELTAAGDTICYSHYGQYNLTQGMTYKKQPLNNSAIAASYCCSLNKPYAGACITLLERDQVLKSYPDNWRKIHSCEDKIVLANHDHMANLRSNLLRLLCLSNDP